MIKPLIGAIISGLISGSLYASMALGLTIVYGVIRIFNFGHGILAVIGGYSTWLFLTQFGLPLLPSILVSLFIMFFFGLVNMNAILRMLIIGLNLYHYYSGYVTYH